MQIARIEIKNFRSISSLNYSPKSSNIICGINSAGKSNILRAIRIVFITNIDKNKLLENFPNNISARAKCKITLQFNKPSSLISKRFKLKKDTPFNYTFEFTKSGNFKRYINNEQLTDQDFEELSQAVTIIYAPAIRDVTTDGLSPFKLSLIENIKNQKGPDSISKLNKELKKIISEKGQKLLNGTNSIAKNWLKVKSLTVNTDKINIFELISEASVNFNFNSKNLSIEKLGTGHQSAIIIKLYKELGSNTGNPVIYLFEEPDNHLHPSSISLISKEIKECSDTDNKQVFLTTHSPYLINQFDFENILILKIDEDRITKKFETNITRSSKDFRMALATYGLKPAEALVSKKIVIVEGPSDLTAIRAFLKLADNSDPEELDMLIIPAGGKSQAKDLSKLMSELNVNWATIYDWDALRDDNIPILNPKLTNEQKQELSKIIDNLLPYLNNTPSKKNKIKKQLESAISNLESYSNIFDIKNTHIGSLINSIYQPKQSFWLDLEKSVKKNYFTIVNRLINPYRIFVWSNDIENVIIPESSENDAFNYLSSQGILNNNIPEEQKINALHKATKKMAYDPEKLTKLIEHIWEKGHYKSKEAIRCISFLKN